jgi:hypothetical protein
VAKPTPPKSGHRKPGKADQGKSNIDKTGKTGKHHGGNLSGSSKKGDGDGSSGLNLEGK